MNARIHAVLMGWAILFITAGMDVLVLKHGVPQNVDSTITGLILGVWHAASGGVIAYFYGSNSESSRKTELLAAATPSTSPNVSNTAEQATKS